jgi:hypothetical protein
MDTPMEQSVESATPGTPAGDPAADWPKPVRSGRISLRPLTAVLAAVLVATLGVWGGAELEKRERPATTGSGAAAALLTRLRGGTGAAGTTGGGGFGGAGGAAGVTFGTVTEVSGKTLYLTSATGALVKVKLTSATTYTRNSKSTKAGLKPGDTAIVQGSAGAKGVVTARSVAATAKGVTTGFGGRGGFGGGGGGTGGQ